MKEWMIAEWRNGLVEGLGLGRFLTANRTNGHASWLGSF